MTETRAAAAATEKRLLTPAEAAENLGLSRRQIYRLIRSNRIRSVKIGKLRRISPAALDAFVEQSEAESATCT